jgi:PBP1b-binding outer membrane lipoprotein LpoB
MKNIVIILGLAASCFMFAGCSSYNNAPEQPMAAPAAESAPAAPAHHDYKGEK